MFEEHGYPGDPLYPMFYSKQIFTANGPSNVVKPNFCTSEETTGTYIMVMHKTFNDTKGGHLKRACFVLFCFVLTPISQL